MSEPSALKRQPTPGLSLAKFVWSAQGWAAAPEEGWRVMQGRVALRRVSERRKGQRGAKERDKARQEEPSGRYATH